MGGGEGLPAAAAGPCLASSALVGGLAAVEYVVVVEERVGQVVELVSLVVGEALEQTLAGVFGKIGKPPRPVAVEVCAEGWEEGREPALSSRWARVAG